MCYRDLFPSQFFQTNLWLGGHIIFGSVHPDAQHGFGWVFSNKPGIYIIICNLYHSSPLFYIKKNCKQSIAVDQLCLELLNFDIFNKHFKSSNCISMRTSYTSPDPQNRKKKAATFSGDEITYSK